MSMPSWPEELGRALLDSYAQSRGENRRISRGDDGPLHVRRGTSKASQNLPVSFFATRDQWARLDRFYIEECEDGALPFLAPDWSADGRDLLTADGENLLTDEDEEIIISSTMACLFAQPPTASAWGYHWRISFELVILP